MKYLQSILYGFLSGVAEFLPISAKAHQAILQQLFDLAQDPVNDFLVHLSLLLALLTGCRAMLRSLNRGRQLSRQARRRAPRERYDALLVRTASAPLLTGMLLLLVTGQMGTSLILVALFLTVNGVLLFLPERMSSGNKDARAMTRMDGFLIGLSGALSVFPGISRVGAAASVAVARGAEKRNALNWALLLSIPALGMLMGFDIFHLIFQGFGSFSLQRLIQYILTCLAAYGGGYAGILTMRFLTVRSGFSGFAYYCWGAALFSFIVYLAI